MGTSTCSMTLSKSNKRKVVDSTATDVINSLSQYLRKLSVDITEDKIAVPDRPNISLSSEEITLEKNFKAGRNFQKFPDKFGPVYQGQTARYIKRKIFEEEEWMYLFTD